MKINVADLKRHIGEEAAYEFSQHVEPVEQYGDTVTFDPVDVHVRLLNSGDSIAAYFRAKTVASMHCSRCLGAYREPILLEFQVVYQQEGTNESRRDGANDSDDVIYYENDLINVSGDVREQVILALPMKPVCDQVCKGLCPSCGQNLNLAKCSCPEEDKGARWTVLRELLKKD